MGEPLWAHCGKIKATCTYRDCGMGTSTSTVTEAWHRLSLPPLYLRSLALTHSPLVLAMTSHSDILGGLLEQEIFWRDRHDWLKRHGYNLRPRYKPGWVPPWKDTGEPPSMYEEGVSVTVPTPLCSLLGFVLTLKT